MVSGGLPLGRRIFCRRVWVELGLTDTSEGIAISIHVFSGLFPENTRPDPSTLPLHAHAFLPKTFFPLCSTQGSHTLTPGSLPSALPPRVHEPSQAASESLPPSCTRHREHVRGSTSEGGPEPRRCRKKAHISIPAARRAVDKDQLLPEPQLPRLSNGDDSSTSRMMRINSTAPAPTSAPAQTVTALSSLQPVSWPSQGGSAREPIGGLSETGRAAGHPLSPRPVPVPVPLAFTGPRFVTCRPTGLQTPMVCHLRLGRARGPGRPEAPQPRQQGPAQSGGQEGDKGPLCCVRGSPRCFHSCIVCGQSRGCSWRKSSPACAQGGKTGQTVREQAPGSLRGQAQDSQAHGTVGPRPCKCPKSKTGGGARTEHP